MAEEQIGRADYVLGVDNTGVKKGVAEAEAAIKASGAKTEAAYTESGQRAGMAFAKAIAKGAAAVAAVGFAVATRGLIELDQVQAEYTAETGATAAEAKRAGDAILAMSSRNIQPIREIGATLTKVRTDLGLTGEDAERTAEQFLRFARATKQDAAASVLAFDDILDAWGLTAADAQHVMDNLVASHQQYGGSISENQRVLAQLAPQLKALNFTIDDSQALLNLFAASGLDAGKAQMALNSAIQKLPPGTSLKDFIAKLATIEDPAERARKAIEIFGTRGGAGLANAIRPGIESLDDFKVSQDEMTGATDRAADALDSSFGARAQLLIKQFGSALIGLGRDLGPALTGLASLTSLAGSLGLPSKLAGAWRAIANSSVVHQAIDGLGKAWGTRLGKGIGITAGGLIVAQLLISTSANAQSIARHVGDLQKQLTEALRAGNIEQLRQVREGLQSQLEDLVAVPFPGLADQLLQKQLSADIAKIDARLAQETTKLSQTEQAAHNAGLQIGGALVDGVGNSGIVSAAGRIIAGAGPAWAEIARQQGNRLGLAVAQGILTRRDAVDTAWQNLLDGIKTGQSVTQRTATLLGRLTSSALIKGLNDSDPAVRAQSRGTKQLILDELLALKPRAGTLSKESMEALRRGMKSKDPEIAAASTAIYNAAISGPKGLTVEKGKVWGGNIGKGIAAGLDAQAKAVGAAAGNLANVIADYLETHSPSKLGPLSRTGGPEGWGRQIVALIARGAEAGLPALNATLSRGLSLSGFDEPWLTQAVVSAAPSATIRVEHAITAEGARNLAAAGFDERQVAAALAEPVDATGLLSNLRGLQAMSGS